MVSRNIEVVGDNGKVLSRARRRFENFSKQPRYSTQKGTNPLDFFLNIRKWTETELSKDPGYKVDSRKRDEWLTKVVTLEPNLMGVINNVVAIDKNRGWKMVGGRNQVLRFTEMLHNFNAAPGLRGWRPAISMASRSFWNTDLGSITEFGRDGMDGPIRQLYVVDPKKCKLTGDPLNPISYGANVKKPTIFRDIDYIRVASMPSYDEELRGLGYCAVSRCLELARIMVAVYEYDKETLGAKAPRGLLLLQGISQQQWNKAMENTDEQLEGLELDYFDAVAVLASRASIDAKMVALSALPTSFNLREWMDMLMYGYALSFGYDASEFYPVQFGALGRGTETEIQHEKATGKGKLDFVLGFQEQFQQFCPDTLDFQFDQRDDKGDLMQAQVQKARVDVVKTLYETGGTSRDQLISADQALSLLADFGVIPRAWVPTEIVGTTDLTEEEHDEELEGPEKSEIETDEENVEPERMFSFEGEMKINTRKARDYKEELLTNPNIMRAVRAFPDEEIIEYDYPSGQVIVIWNKGSDAISKRIF